MTFTQEERELLFPREKQDLWKLVFRLTRFVRQNRELLHTHEEEEIREYIRAWMAEAVERFPEARRDIIEDDIWMQIVQKWDFAHWPLGFDLIAAALKRSKDHPHVPPTPAKYGECHALVWRVLWNINLICLKAGETDFFVSSRILAQHLDYSQPVVFRALQRIERDKLITVKTRGQRGTIAGKATLYNVF